ncbi:hypothetical protein [Pinibacter aurantiacus]|uniref:Uncharacterized protein n=1 Tax=Pinibacter aurantiacus TaxID=2851599 RepID=A0A9E2W6N0_9BACT|nr:hypothetical protein [Pinibacter aurantiacus]MBV4360018.1 hypothetical protein [Pinibacter aurantiacus]
MKTKGLLFGLIAIVSTFTLGSCKKDNTPSNSFSYNSQSYETLYAFGAGESSGSASYTDVTFLSYNPTLSATTTKVSAGFIEFGSFPLAAGTYTYKAFDDPAFDATKNFADADFGINMNFKDGDYDDASGTQLNEADITSGTITVEKSGDVYTFTYNITYKTGTVSGRYNGKVTGL